jgi:hypothetical protein
MGTKNKSASIMKNSLNNASKIDKKTPANYPTNSNQYHQ